MKEEVTPSFIESLPKTELHSHMEGALSLETLHDLLPSASPRARREVEQRIEATLGTRIDLSRCSLEALSHVVRWTTSTSDRDRLGVPAAITKLVLQEPHALARVAREIVLENAAQNVRYLELRLAPLAHTLAGLPLPEVVETVLGGLRCGETNAKPSIRANLIISGPRQDVYGTIIAAELACAYKTEGVVAFDLSGPEDGHPPRRHREAFQIIENHLLPVTVHAGESHGPRSIREALFLCSARRLGHGTRVYQDGDLFRYIVDQRIPLECCLSSNVCTRTVHAYGSHPLRTYLKRGVRVTLNTDYPLFANTTLSAEYAKAATHHLLDADELRRIAWNGFKSTFASHECSRVIRKEVRAKLFERSGL